MKILWLAFPGFTFIDLAGLMQAMSLLPEATSQIVWQEEGRIKSDASVEVVATNNFNNSWSDPDILFVPGNTNALFNLLENDRTLDFVADRGSRAKWVMSVCNGSLLLGAAGLLQG
jgi:cyclohexyl-isocyanide hydratase